LTLDTEPATYFLIIATWQQMPRMTEPLGQARALGSMLLARKEATPAQRVALEHLVAGTRQGLNDLTITLDKAFQAEPAFKAALSAPLQKAQAQVDAAVRQIRQDILEANTLTAAPESYFKALSEGIDAVYAINAEASGLLESALNQRVNTTLRLEWSLAAGLVLMMALALWLGLVIARGETFEMIHRPEPGKSAETQ
jgi:hypothetical protein